MYTYLITARDRKETRNPLPTPQKTPKHLGFTASFGNTTRFTRSLSNTTYHNQHSSCLQAVPHHLQTPLTEGAHRALLSALPAALRAFPARWCCTIEPHEARGRTMGSPPLQLRPTPGRDLSALYGDVFPPQLFQSSFPSTHSCSLTQLPVPQQPLLGGPHNFSHSLAPPLGPAAPPPQHLGSCPFPQLLPLDPRSPWGRQGEGRAARPRQVRRVGTATPGLCPPAPQPAPLGEHQQLKLTIWQHVFLLRLPPHTRGGSVFRRSPQKRTAQAPTWRAGYGRSQRSPPDRARALRQTRRLEATERTRAFPHTTPSQDRPASSCAGALRHRSGFRACVSDPAPPASPPQRFTFWQCGCACAVWLGVPLRFIPHYLARSHSCRSAI